jgi:hypothetical protein
MKSMIKLTAMLSVVLFGAFSKASDDPRHVEIENAYTNSDGKMIIQFDYKSSTIDGDKVNPDFFGANLTFYGDANGFVQLEQTGFEGTSDDYHLGFEDERMGSKEGDFEARPKEGRYELTCDGNKQNYRQLSDAGRLKLQTDIRSGKVKLSSLPQDVRQPEYVFEVDGSDDSIYIDAPKYNYNYDFRVFIGPKGNMKEVKSTDVRRFNDGGTTYISLADGTKIYSPTAFKQDEKPTWNGKTLTRLDHREFDVKSLGINGNSSAAISTPCDKFAPVIRQQ